MPVQNVPARTPVELSEWLAIASNLSGHLGRGYAQAFLAANFFLVVKAHVVRMGA